MQRRITDRRDSATPPLNSSAAGPQSPPAQRLRLTDLDAAAGTDFIWVVDQRTTYDVFRETILACVERAKQPGFPAFVPIIQCAAGRLEPSRAGRLVAGCAVLCGSDGVRCAAAAAA